MARLQKTWRIESCHDRIPKVVKIGPVESEIGERIKLQRLERLAKIQEESKVQQPRDQIELMDSDN